MEQPCILQNPGKDPSNEMHSDLHFLQCVMPLDTEQRGLGFLIFFCTFSQEFTANYFTHGRGGCTGTRHLPILLPLGKHFTHVNLLSDSLSGLITITPCQQYKNTRRISRARCVYCSTASWAVHVQDSESDTGHCDKCSFCSINENLFTVL